MVVVVVVVVLDLLNNGYFLILALVLVHKNYTVLGCDFCVQICIALLLV